MKSLSGQSILDIAIQTAGSAEAAVLLALANRLSITDELTAGQELTTVTAIDRDIFNYYTNNQLKPATAITATAGGSTGTGEGEADEGIEFWYVEYEFAVN
jgi:hypothetical protein